MPGHKDIDFAHEFVEWDNLCAKLAILFREKDVTRKDYMDQGIQLLEVILGKANESAPINFSERFTFVKNNTHNYTAFLQLVELFKETKKKIAVKRIMDNK